VTAEAPDVIIVDMARPIATRWTIFAGSARTTRAVVVFPSIATTAPLWKRRSPPGSAPTMCSMQLFRRQADRHGGRRDLCKYQQVAADLREARTSLIERGRSIAPRPS